MNAGKLRHIIDIVTTTTADNPAGEREPSGETVVAGINAEVRPSNSRELMNAGMAIGSDTMHTITLRYRDEITAKQTVRFGTRRFEIAGIVNPGERNIELQLLCHEVNR